MTMLSEFFRLKGMKFFEVQLLEEIVIEGSAESTIAISVLIVAGPSEEAVRADAEKEAGAPGDALINSDGRRVDWIGRGVIEVRKLFDLRADELDPIDELPTVFVGTVTFGQNTTIESLLSAYRTGGKRSDLPNIDPTG